MMLTVHLMKRVYVDDARSAYHTRKAGFVDCHSLTHAMAVKEWFDRGHDMEATVCCMVEAFGGKRVAVPLQEIDYTWREMGNAGYTGTR